MLRHVYFFMVGGEPGKKGLNKLIKKNGDEMLLSGKSKVEIEPWVWNSLVSVLHMCLHAALDVLCPDCACIIIL